MHCSRLSFVKSEARTGGMWTSATHLEGRVKLHLVRFVLRNVLEELLDLGTHLQVLVIVRVVRTIHLGCAKYDRQA